MIFRRGKWSNYNPDDYNKPQHLPLGFAAAFAAGCGVMGAVLGMATEWYIGILGRKSTYLYSRSAFLTFDFDLPADGSFIVVGYPAFGGDIGFELSFAFSAIAYPIARTLERRYESSARLRSAAEGAAEYAAQEKSH